MQTARLLIIDGDPASAAALRALAQQRGYDTAIAAAPRDLPRLIDAFRPTDVFLDASMDQLGGVESLLVLSQLSCDANIIVCGLADPRFAEAVWRFGRVNGLSLVEVLPKPLDLPAMSAVLATLNRDPVSACAGATGI